jgi:hypothetical protein
MNSHIYPVIGDTPINQIDRDMILKVLRPLWTDHRDTAKKVRGQMEKIIAAGYAGHGLKPGDIPCVWKTTLRVLSPLKVRPKSRTSRCPTPTPLRSWLT